jgi:prepilin-type N-terminal cleavage/methylation domain-containing protein
MKTQMSSQRGFSLIELLIVVAIIGIIAAITVTYLLQAKQAARSASAAHSMRLIHSCEAAYHASSGLYGDLNDLSATKFLNDPDLMAGRKSGYNFTATPDTSTPALNYVAIASPVSDPASSLKNYFIDGSGVLRVNIGTAADATSMAVGN